MYPGTKLDGVVEAISAGSGATFSVLPPENATGNWVKVTQRFPIRIRITSRPIRRQAVAGGRQRRRHHRHHRAGRRRKMSRPKRGGGKGRKGGQPPAEPPRPVAARASSRTAADPARHRRGADRGAGSARHHHRQRGDPAYAGRLRRHGRPDHLGADLLYRRRRRGDAAHRLSLQMARAQAASAHRHHRLHRLLGLVRPGVEPREHGAVPPGAGRVRRAARPLEPGDPARCLPAPPRRPGAGHFRSRHHGGAGDRARARRLSDRGLFLAHGVLHQRADRPVRPADVDRLSAVAGDQGHQDRLDRHGPLGARGRRAAIRARSRARCATGSTPA